MKKNQRGFTIIELIVVIAVIAVLAAIIVTNVSIYTNKAKGTAFRASVNEFIKAVKLKKADTNSLTTSMIYRTNTYWGDSYKTVFNTNFGNYISDFPKPPFSGAIYYYYYEFGPCDGSPYMLLIYGAQNQSFFSDWVTWPLSSSYKCFPLN